MMTDPIADMIARLRNANAVFKPYVEIPFSTFRESVLRVLKAERYISDWELLDKNGRKFLRVHLLYSRETPVITRAKKVSTPGKRVYVSLEKMKSMKQASGIMVLSTPKGVVSGKKAQELGTGGEVLFYIW